MNTQSTKNPIIGDSMVYGLACDGTTDSVIVVYPFSGKDPIVYSIIDAKQANKVIGKPSIGDWVGLVIDKDDSTTATMVVNLDMLKGTWTYPVMPTMKDFKNLSKRMQRRMEKLALQEMPDSVKELYMVPREYGFSLKRGHTAQPVGMVYSGSSIEDDSPVEYPAVKRYKEWYSWNGKLILIAGARRMASQKERNKIPDTYDTLDFVSLDEDSLVLSMHGAKYSFHRKENALSANADATKKAVEAAAKQHERLTK